MSVLSKILNSSLPKYNINPYSQCGFKPKIVVRFSVLILFSNKCVNLASLSPVCSIDLFTKDNDHRAASKPHCYSGMQTQMLFWPSRHNFRNIELKICIFFITYIPLIMHQILQLWKIKFPLSNLLRKFLDLLNMTKEGPNPLIYKKVKNRGKFYLSSNNIEIW